MDDLFEKSNLPKKVDEEFVRDLLNSIRTEYEKNK